MTRRQPKMRGLTATLLELTLTLAVTLGLVLASAARPAAAAPAASGADAVALKPETERAWRAYVAATEARIARELSAPASSPFLVLDHAREAADARAERARILAGDVPLGEMTTRDQAGGEIETPDALISHWRGSILLPGVTLADLWTRLQHPNERGPFPPDVLALRVLARQPDALTLFIKMTRQKVVTVTYNTEHQVTFRRDRAAATRGSSRSVATRIAEVEQTPSGERELAADEEHGFLWRLHAYWRYEQVEAGVIVELESLTLSRDIPLGLGLIVRPLVDRVARESMTRTLTGIRREYAPAAPAAPASPAPPAATRRSGTDTAASGLRPPDRARGGR